MRRIILSPFSRPLRNGKPNPKNYPHWDALIDKLHADGHYLIQVGSTGEPRLAVDEIQTDYATFLDENAEPFNCLCGAANCRGLIKGEGRNSFK